MRSFRLLPGQAPGPLPAPTGGTDAHYREVAPLAPPFALYQDLTQIQAIAMLDDLVAVEGREYGVAFPARTTPTARPAITVYLKGVQGGTFSGIGEIIDPGNSERTTPVTVDVRSGTIVDIQQLLEALAAPLRTVTSDNQLIGHNTLDEAANAGTEDCVVQLNRGIVRVEDNGEFGGGRLQGNGAVIEFATGKMLVFHGTNTLVADCFFGGDAPQVGLTTASMATVYFSRVYLQYGVTVLAGSTAFLQDSTRVPDTFLPSLTHNPDGTYTTPDGGTVIDERGANITADDIEITDLTKGVIQRSPNGTRWRLAVSNTGVVTATLA